MLYIKICTIWYISCDIYHGVYGIYESKVVYTMTQPSRCLSPVQWLRLLRPPRVCGRERWLVTDDLDSYTLRQASPSGSRWTKQSMPTARGRGPPPLLNSTHCGCSGLSRCVFKLFKNDSPWRWPGRLSFSGLLWGETGPGTVREEWGGMGERGCNVGEWGGEKEIRGHGVGVLVGPGSDSESGRRQGSG